LVAVDANATVPPSAAIVTALVAPLSCAPALDVETTRVSPDDRFVTNASTDVSRSAGSRLDARLRKATRDPSGDNDGRSDMLSPG
jgi:hypothetical protein